MKKVELLIPVGNKECLYAAIHNGADAVYLGGKKFGARAYSNNFDQEEMCEAIKLCHLYGVKIYVTVNTMIYNNEISEVIEYLNFLHTNGVDAVIMQDTGLIALTRKIIPDLEIHVSTQAHNHNESGINFYKKIGCTRVVFDRESSLEEITSINVDIEKEVFVYGALCICYSGNCLFSALNGGRSANKGMCAGACRLPYSLLKNGEIKDSGYLLSTKSLNTLNNLKEILDANIDSLKIEGRMKSKEYVAIVTKTFRKLIDCYYNNEPITYTEEDKTKLLKTYNREFTSGYLFNEENIINKRTSNHQGIPIGTVIGVNNKRITIKLTENIHQEDAIRFDKTSSGMFINFLYNEKGSLVSEVKKGNICQLDNKERIMIKDLLGSKVLKTIDVELNKELNNIQEKKIPITISITAKIGNKLKLEITDNVNNIIIEGKIVEQAKTSSIEESRIKEQLNKLGSTPFVAKNIDIQMDKNIFISIKELNELRRNSTEKLTELRKGQKTSEKNIIVPEPIVKIDNNKKISILTRTEDQLKIALANKIDIIYTTSEELYNKYKEYKNIFLRLKRVNIKHKEYTNERLLCTEFGSVLKYSKFNTIRTDYYLNVANDYTINELNKLGSTSITLSVELTPYNLSQIKNKKDSEIIVYGTPECMIIKNNIFNIQNEKTELVNTKGEKFLVLFENDYTHIFQHKPINLLENKSKLKNFGTYRIELLNENISQTQSIINKVKDML